MEGTIGEIRMFAGNFSPKAWAYCAGQIMAIQSNTALFSILGTIYGGNGTSTFGLPNMQGRAAVGAGQGAGLSSYSLGETAGTETITLNITQMPAHTHMVLPQMTAVTTPGCYSDSGTTNSPVNNFPAVSANTYATGPDGGMAAQQATVTLSNAQIGPSGGNQPHSNLQPIIGMNYIICLQGYYPSRN